MYYVIVNPASKSGRGAKIFAELKPILEKQNVPYVAYFSERAGHVTEIVRKLCATVPATGEHPLKLLVLGGDGTMNEALQGISDFDSTVIGYIPTGSSNDLARDLSLPKDPKDVLMQILSCKKATAMDLGCVTYESISADRSRKHAENHPKKRYFAVSCGIGFDAAVCEEALASRFKNILNKVGLGKLTYLVIALKQLLAAKKISCDITLENAQPIHLNHCLFVASMIHQYEGGGFQFCPGADAHDGVLDICAVGDISKGLVLMALPTAFKGQHYKFDGIDRHAASALRLTTSAPLWVHTDGEVSVKATAITLTCEKEKLQMLI